MKYEYITIFLACLNLFGSSYYAYNTIIGKTKPNKIVWLIWAISPIIGAVASFSDGNTFSQIPVLVAGLGPLIIFISSFFNKKSYWELKRFDYFCLFLAFLALFLWFITKNPLVAIVLTVIIDGLGAIPMIIKMYKYPETETILPFILSFFTDLSAFLIMKNRTLEEILFPAYLVTVCFILIILYFRKRIVNLFR